MSVHVVFACVSPCACVSECVCPAAADTEEHVDVHPQRENSRKHMYDTFACYRAAV